MPYFIKILLDFDSQDFRITLSFLQPVSLDLTGGQLEFDFESMSPRSGYTSSDTNAQVKSSLATLQNFLSFVTQTLV